MLNGQIAPDRGAVRLMGETVTGSSRATSRTRASGRTFQITATYGSMTVRENVQTALIAGRGGEWSWRGRAAALHRQDADALLDLVGIARPGGARLRRAGLRRPEARRTRRGARKRA